MLVFFIIIVVLVIMLKSLTIKFKFENIEISNHCKVENIKINNYSKFKNISNHRKSKQDNEVKIQFYLFKYIKIASIKINNKQIKKEYFNKIVKNYLKKDLRQKRIFNFLKTKKVGIEKLDLDLKLGLEDVVATTKTVALLGTAISIFLRNRTENLEKCNYNILPIYTQEQAFSLKLDLTISIKV